MNEIKFSQTEIFGFGWEKAKKFVFYFLCLFFAIFAINFLIAFLKDAFGKLDEGMFLIDLLSCFFDLVTGLGMIKVALCICNGNTPKSDTFFNNFDIFLNYSVGFILYLLMIIFGMFLFVIPGIIFLVKFQFFGYFIADKKIGPIEALKESSRITIGIKMQLILFGVFVVLINILGACALGIGLIVSIPTTIIAHCALYKKLTCKL